MLKGHTLCRDRLRVTEIRNNSFRIEASREFAVDSIKSSSIEPALEIMRAIRYSKRDTAVNKGLEELRDTGPHQAGCLFHATLPLLLRK